jgi:hypothetical protein
MYAVICFVLPSNSAGNLGFLFIGFYHAERFLSLFVLHVNETNFFLLRFCMQSFPLYFLSLFRRVHAHTLTEIYVRIYIHIQSILLIVY